MDPQLEIFRRQYFQLFEPGFLAWPPKQLLRDASAQAWLYNNLFNPARIARRPPESYQIRVLKPLMAKVEHSIEDPEEDELSDDLMSHLSDLMTLELPGEAVSAQQKAYVTFTCLHHSPDVDSSAGMLQSITLLERRQLISGSLTTGYRTWEAALHLGAYLLTPDGRSIVRDRNVFELGAGTGFISILCSKLLVAKHVTATDGDEGVVEALKENLFVNGLDDQSRVGACVLRWGHNLKGSWVEDECDTWPYDVVLGADITYDKVAISALVTTFRYFFDLRPRLEILVSGAVRNIDTFDTFRNACIRNKFTVREIEFQPKPMRDQTALFYATAVPLKILSITTPDK